MQTFPLGSFHVGRVGYGAMQLPGPGVLGPPRDHDEAIAVLRRAIELGINHIDTAQFYGPNVANELIREALHPYPADLALVSKVGARRDDDGAWLAAQEPDDLRAEHRGEPAHAGDRPAGRGQPARARRRADPNAPADVDRELFDRQLDRDDQRPRRRPHRRHRLEQRRSRPSATSHWTAPRSCACRTPTTSSTGPPSRCSTHASSTTSRSYRSSRSAPAFVADNPVLGHPAVQREAAKLGRTPAQIALAWTLSIAPNVLLIPGTSSVKHLEENTAVADIELDAETKRQLDDAGA